MQNFYEAIAANKRKSAVIMVAFVVFVCLVVYVLANALTVYSGYEPGGLGLAGLALIVSGGMSFGSYYFSDKIVLTISGAKEAKREEYFDFYTVVENLSIAANLPKPKLYVIDDTAMNAFATGRDPEHAVICATTGILERLTRTELEGVIGHEMTHIKNYDIRLMSVVAVLVGMIALLGDWFLRIGFRGRRSDGEGNVGALIVVVGIILALLSPIIAQLIQLAISRRREFFADAGSVAITRQPSGLISALEKLAADKEPLEAANKATAHLYITNPLKNRRDAVGWFANLFNTHPPIERRLEALAKMS